LVTGFVISIFQAVTQIQEQTLTFIPKILVSALAILFFGPFMLAMLTSFMATVFRNMPQYVK
jgi:flagellar biosynthetic protein FliQ